MGRVLIATAAALALAQSVAAQSVSGTVLDPQDRTVPGARIDLTCGGHRATVATNVRGQFLLPWWDQASASFLRWDQASAWFPLAPETIRCELVVTKAGFAPFRDSVRPGSPTLTIRLQIAPVAQTISVSATAESKDAPRLALSSVSLGEEDLRRLGNRVNDLLQYAKAMAGAPFAQDAIYIEGLPGAVPPAAAAIARITVNDDPFSAEYADSDRNHIEISLKDPDRRLRATIGGTGLGAGGRSPLASGLDASSRSVNLGASGPVPRLPVAFALHVSAARSREQEPLVAASDHAGSSGTAEQPYAVPLGSDSWSTSMSIHLTGSKSLRATASLFASGATAVNAGAGGFALPEARTNSESSTRALRMTVSRVGSRQTYRGGFVHEAERFRGRANSHGPGITVFDRLIGGGAFTAAEDVQRSYWFTKHVVGSNPGHRAWRVGVSADRTIGDVDEAFNEGGMFRLRSIEDLTRALAGERVASWIVTRGAGRIAHATTTAAAFAERALLTRTDRVVRAGMRLDYQRGDGALLSPRVSLAARARTLTLRGGAGVMVTPWSNDVLLQATKKAPGRVRQWLVQPAAFFDSERESDARGRAIASGLAPDLARPRDLVLKASAERAWGALALGVEHTWTRGLHRLGSRRLAHDNGWLDVLESNRRLHRHQVQARAQYSWKQQGVVGYYTWTGSRDDTDGSFSFPERSDDLGREWARSAGVPRHSGTIVAALQLPHGVSASVVAIFRGSAPYNVMSGLDLERNGLFTDRAGAPRNSGIGPPFRTVDLAVHRRISLPPAIRLGADGLAVDAGLRVDNLFGSQNFIGYGSVLGSPMFGRPWAAYPGRSVRVWFALAR